MDSNKAPSLSAKEIKDSLFVIGSWTLFGRVIGLFKDFLLARFLGIGAQADAFLLAFRIPNIFRATFAEGSIPAALVPIVSQLFKQGQTKRVQQLLTLTCGTVGLVGLVVWGAILLWPKFVLLLLASGLDLERQMMCVRFLQILFPLLLLFSQGSLVTSVLQAANSFRINAAGPAIFNIISIGVLLLGIYFNLSIEFVCVGFLLAGVTKLASKFFVLGAHELLPTVPGDATGQDFVKVFHRFAPLSFGVIFSLLNACFETQTASFLPVGQISLLHYMFRTFNLVLYTVALPIENILLPQLSKLDRNSMRDFNFYLQESCKLILILSFPATILAVFLADKITFLLLATNANAGQLILARDILIILCLGTFFNIFNRVLGKFFFALGDTKTPTLIWGFSIICNIVLCVIFLMIFKLQARAVICSTIISWTIAFVLKIFFLHKSYLVKLQSGNILVFLRKLLWQIVPAAVFLLIAKCWIWPFLSTQLLGDYLLVNNLIFIGFVWIIFAWLVVFVRRNTLCKFSKIYFIDID